MRWTLVLSIVALALSIFAGPEPPTCLGLGASEWTARGYNVVYNGVGTWKNDVIFGTPGNDTINGGNGNDVICGGDGDDTINGGTGHDVLVGEGGNDIVRGESGNDYVIGDRVEYVGDAVAPPLTTHGSGWYCGACESNPQGDDVYLFGRKYVQVLDGAGDDTLSTAEGGAGAPINVGEFIVAGAGNDVATDTDGDTFIELGPGNDVAFGNEGNDTIDCGDGEDWADGGQNQGGTDPVSGLSAIDIAEANCENITNVP